MMVAGTLAALWLVGLLIAAPALRSSHRYGLADRLRDALLLGIAIPFALALAHALYPIASWIVLATVVVIAFVRERRRADDPLAAGAEREPLPYLAIVVLALVAWPQLVRPMLEGDSLAYHLPNAAAWANAHSIWISTTRYWWYPPGSELFAAGLFSVSGPFALGWGNTLVSALLAFRLATWCRESFGTSPLLADAIAAATIAMPLVALQSGTLQNDTWLAAMMLETIWATYDRSASIRAAIATALIKPYGFVIALLALPISWLRIAAVLAAAAFIAIREFVLVSDTHMPLVTTYYGNTWPETMIVSHGLTGFTTLATALVQASLLAAVAYAVAMFSPVWERKERMLAWTGCFYALLFLVLPFTFDNPLPKLATGDSLRYALPAMVIGVLFLARFALRAERIATVVFVALAAYGSYTVMAIFWNDSTTRTALGVAVVVVLLAYFGERLRPRYVLAATLALAVVAGAHLAGKHPADYYVDSTAVGAARSHVFGWIVANKPSAIGVLGLRAGALNVLDPSATVIDLTDARPCDDAKASHALALYFADGDHPAAFNATRQQHIAACGTTLYADALATIVTPR